MYEMEDTVLQQIFAPRILLLLSVAAVFLSVMPFVEWILTRKASLPIKIKEAEEAKDAWQGGLIGAFVLFVFNLIFGVFGLR